MFEKIWDKFLTIFGKIKIFKYPMFIIYEPNGYKVTGEETEKILNLIKDGDILVRGYYDYLDGKFIKGFFSHAGFYYENNIIIHAIAEGVQKDHIIDFCRCDYLAVLRFKPGLINDQDIKAAKEIAISLLGDEYDFDFSGNNNQYYCTEAVMKIWEKKLNITPTKVKELFGLIKRDIIFPDQLYNCDALDKILITSEVPIWK